MSRTTEIRHLRDEIVSLRDEIRQLRRTIEHERVPMMPYPYPIYPWWPRPYYPPAWWIWWDTGMGTYEASDEINGGATVTYASEEARRHAAQRDFPGFSRDWLTAPQGQFDTWASAEMLADAYAHAHGGPGGSTYTDPATGEQVPWWYPLPKSVLSPRDHSKTAKQDRDR